MKLLIKGILTHEDASLCVEHGVDGIIVSNHGGRVVDSGLSTIEVLPEIARSVGGRILILIDSGFRRGSDFFKALALGASAVCLGRPPLWGLAAFGQEGVEAVLDMRCARNSRPSCGRWARRPSRPSPPRTSSRAGRAANGSWRSCACGPGHPERPPRARAAPVGCSDAAPRAARRRKVRDARVGRRRSLPSLPRSPSRVVARVPGPNPCQPLAALLGPTFGTLGNGSSIGTPRA